MARREPPVPQTKAEPRRVIPMKLQRDAALKLCASLMAKLGLVESAEGVAFELDNDPALVLREVDPVTRQHVPHQHDPGFLVWRTKEAHDRKTNGRGGEKRATTYGSDKHVAAKLKRISDDEIARFSRQVLSPSERPAASSAKPATKWAKRPMRTRREPKLSPARTPEKLAGLRSEARP